MINKKSVALLMMVMFLSACSDKLVKNKPVTENQSSMQNRGYKENSHLGAATSIGLGKSQNRYRTVQGESLNDANSLLSKRIIYFEYDSSNVQQEFLSVIEAHAIYLTNNPNQAISLEGYSDERGTRGYNVALAEKRARSVFKMLQVLGVMSYQVNIVSYGEEKPASLGHNEKAFSLNRRVEVVYK
jgi:peptidoglycan-associated lipoprotein